MPATNPTANSTINERLEFVGLDKAQIETLKACQTVISESIEDALSRFYEKIVSHPETAHFFSEDRILTHAKSRQGQHWEEISTGQFNDAYVTAVTTIGKTHARIGLEPRWYIGGYALILESLIHAIVKDQIGFLQKNRAKKTANKVSAIVKAALVDMDLAIAVYLDAQKDARMKEQQEKEVLSTQRDEAIKVLDQSLMQLANGDLTVRIDGELAPEFQQIKTNFNEVAASLQKTISEIREQATEAFSSVHELSSATNDLSRRTEGQAASLEETSAALEEITAIANQAALRTKETQVAVQLATNETTSSREVVEQTVNAMSEIERSSKKITEIIDVIDDISFQTNLLALNAGVEAARAGDAGRGFAVVAQEVRALAQRSATEAREIKVLIKQASDDVERGVSLVNETGEALLSIGNRIREINTDIDTIVTSSHEQQTGIREINCAVNSLDTVTQQNAAMVEQTNAATQNLALVAQNLLALIDKFKN